MRLYKKDFVIFCFFRLASIRHRQQLSTNDFHNFLPYFIAVIEKT